MRAASCPTDKRLGMPLWAVENAPDGPAGVTTGPNGALLFVYAFLKRMQLVKP
jgi:hypothetical protein